MMSSARNSLEWSKLEHGLQVHSTRTRDRGSGPRVRGAQTPALSRVCTAENNRATQTLSVGRGQSKPSTGSGRVGIIGDVIDDYFLLNCFYLMPISDSALLGIEIYSCLPPESCWRRGGTRRSLSQLVAPSFFCRKFRPLLTRYL